MRLLKKHVQCVYDEFIKLSDLKPNPKNPNVHPPMQVSLIARIIKEHGWRVPITVSNLSGYIVRGHGRLLAAKELGFDKAPIDYQDYDSPEDEMADLIADNKIAELSSWNDALVKSVLSEMADKSNQVLTGFDLDEIEDVLGDSDAFLNQFLKNIPANDPETKLEPGTIEPEKFHRLPMEFSYSNRDFITATVTRFQEVKKIQMTSSACYEMVEEFREQL